MDPEALHEVPWQVMGEGFPLQLITQVREVRSLLVDDLVRVRLVERRIQHCAEAAVDLQKSHDVRRHLAAHAYPGRIASFFDVVAFQ